jgi:preprotein translocase subunit SecF
MHIIKNRNLYFILPGALVVLSLLSIALFGLKPGVDLRGGTLLEVSYETRPPIEEVRARVAALPIGEVRVQPTGETGFIVRSRDVTPEEKTALIQALSVEDSAAVEERFTSIGPTIGRELMSKAWIAIVLVALATVLYIAFVFRHVSKPVESWKYGAMSIVTLLHDIIIPTGLFALLGYFFGAEVDSLFIVAILTILGISINDTIVVFDRIRENLKVNGEHKIKEPFETVVGKSIDQTIARSVNTSMTVIIALLSLVIWGPESTRNFALTLTVGMIAGTYSSVFLASPLLVTWEKLSHRKK